MHLSMASRPMQAFKFANAVDEGAQVIVRWDPKNPPKAGQTVTVTNLPGAVHLFDSVTGCANQLITD